MALWDSEILLSPYNGQLGKLFYPSPENIFDFVNLLVALFRGKLEKSFQRFTDANLTRKKRRQSRLWQRCCSSVWLCTALGGLFCRSWIQGKMRKIRSWQAMSFGAKRQQTETLTSPHLRLDGDFPKPLWTIFAKSAAHRSGAFLKMTPFLMVQLRYLSIC